MPSTQARISPCGSGTVNRRTVSDTLRPCRSLINLGPVQVRRCGAVPPSAAWSGSYRSESSSGRARSRSRRSLPPPFRDRNTEHPRHTSIGHTLRAGQHDPGTLNLTPIRRLRPARSTSDNTISTAEGPRCDTNNTGAYSRRCDGLPRHRFDPRSREPAHPDTRRGQGRNRTPHQAVTRQHHPREKSRSGPDSSPCRRSVRTGPAIDRLPILWSARLGIERICVCRRPSSGGRP